ENTNNEISMNLGVFHNKPESDQLNNSQSSKWVRLENDIMDSESHSKSDGLTNIDQKDKESTKNNYQRKNFKNHEKGKER
ncbi:13492_t:CDS:1, partial [Gigaspora margarita]